MGRLDYIKILCVVKSDNKWKSKITMDLSQLPFQAKTLKRATSPDKYNLYRAAFEWDLAEPIVIEDRDDMRSESKWRDRVDPYHHQVTNLI